MVETIKLFAILCILLVPIALVNELSRYVFGKNWQSTTITVIFIFAYAGLVHMFKIWLRRKKGLRIDDE
jgi:hypothetical protein